MQNSKTFSSVFRNNSIHKKTTTRINSLQKQFKLSQQQTNNNPLQDNIRQQSQVVKDLLQIKDQNVQWREKNFDNKRSNRKKPFKQTSESLNYSMSKIIPNKYQKSQPNENQAQIQSSQQQLPFETNSLHKRNSHLQCKDKIKTKYNTKNSQQQNQNNKIHNKFKDKKSNTFFMNRTHYWAKSNTNKQHSQLSSNQLILTQKLLKKILPNQTFYQKNRNYDNLRINSNIEFYRNKSPFGDQNQHQTFQYIQSTEYTEQKLIKIQPNKAITVRQMLTKIKSHQDINFIEPFKQKSKLSQLIQIHRQPFNPYQKKTPRQHYKKFTPFKIQQQKKLQFSLQRLQDHLKKNPQIESNWEQIQMHYLQKPAYCSWVQRNKERIKPKRNCPLTVKPLKLVN